MATNNPPAGVLVAISDEIAGAVERAAPAVVTVQGRRRGPASGIVWNANGVIVTADHVVERDEDLSVTLTDGNGVAATLVGRDPASDVAVLRLATPAPSPAQLATGSPVKVGSLALALGRGGLGAIQASFGIISAAGGPLRTARGGTLASYLRADLTFYPGFSGGPLVDPQGQVIGMNSSRIIPGLELAIPTATLSSIVQTLLTQGRIRRAYLGVSSQPVELPAALKQKLGASQDTGLIVVGVEAGSPAERAGLVIGDVLINLAGHALTNGEDLQAALTPNLIGQSVSLIIARAGEAKTLNVTPGERS
ncbi:MAG TPA: S1C family serine protease [Chloroflexota bacterium]|nr:S1C family serine protease [Chloroflexota bacterium]